ncbi:MAG TPA: sialate O-acetylesterase, partial [Cellvibrio sp.]|nr:sialate O-acetylesterase [Cellvibrio sp.]
LSVDSLGVASEIDAVALVGEHNGSFGRHDKALFLLNFENASDLGEDVSGNDRDGVASAVTQTASLDGWMNVATFIPANDSGIDMSAHLADFSASPSLSFSGWVRVNSAADIQSVISASDETQASRDLILFIESGSLLFQIRDSSNIFRISAEDVIVADSWYHVAFSSGPSGAKLWLNATSVGTNASTASIASIVTNRCQIGYNVDDNGSGVPRRQYEFDGFMKDLLLSTVELNQSTVSDIYVNDIYSYEVIHLPGQSNQIGRADIVAGVDDDYSVVGGKVFQWGYNAQARAAAVNPLDHVNEQAGDMGHWMAMCNALVPLLAYKQAIMLTPCAQGGTGFATNNWNPGDSLYENALTRMNQSMGYHAWSNLRAIHWIQGETDADNNATAGYQAALEAMYDDLDGRADGFSVEVPFIAVTILGSTVPANVPLINAALAAFVADGPERYLVDATDLTLFDSFHYDAASLREIGARSAAILSELSESDLLVVEGAQVSIGAEAVSLVQSNILDVGDVLAQATVDAVALSVAATISVTDIDIAVALDNVALIVSSAELLSVESVDVAISAEAIALIQAHILALGDLLVGASADGVVLAPNSAIVVAGSSLSVSVDSVVLNQSGLLVVDNASLAISAESPVLIQQNALAVNDSRLSIFMDSLTIGGGVFVTESALGMIIRDFQYVLLVEG